jgi:pyruvate-formate lyase-activating enzyme
MEKIKRLVNIHIPGYACNLKCNYCYVTHRKLYDEPLPKFKYTPEEVRKALSKERLEGTCLLSLTATGETLLHPQVVHYIRAFLEEGHYVHVVTNGTVRKRFEEIAAFPPELFKRLFFKFSYHYFELKSKNLMDTFFSNIHKMYEIGASFTLEATPSDEMIPYIDEMKEVAIKNAGAVCHLTVGRDQRIRRQLPILTNMDNEGYKKTWSIFNSSLFDYKMEIFGVKRKEFCYAGDWAIFIDLATGNMTQCYDSIYTQNIFKDIAKPVRFFPVGCNCRSQHCYNGHAMLAFGIIPELKAPTYAEMRNKICADNSEWLYPEMKSCFETKLYETNLEYTSWKKFKVNVENRLRKMQKFIDIRRYVSKIKRILAK